MRLFNSVRKGIRDWRREESNIHSLRTLHLIVAGVHLAFIFMFYMLDATHKLPVTMYKTVMRDGEPIVPVSPISSIDIMTIITVYLSIAAVAHILSATILNRRYNTYLRQHRNPLRWIEYSLSCSLMFVALSASAGITLLSVLVALFVASMVMNLLGMVFENVNRRLGKVEWSPFIVGSIIGALPWIILAIGLMHFADGTNLSFIYGVYAVVFTIFALFPINAWLTAKRIGPWRSYVTTEFVYIALSMTAKTTLAIILYFGLMR